ncbi:MAG: glycosyltransferase family 39 protein [Halieaceae bacterium]|jgi:4-amino-4-deoxy-L-arabinose transferase-like glycosyltransferase|nr:glycosyltransferase family 39 protein [Halieaceae bacterium]
MRSDRLALAGVMAFALLVLSSGFAMHEPWPADSPRFAAVARDMLATGDWLFPRVGGDLYPDKPPFFFWLMAASMWLGGSVRAGYLLPSLLAGLGSVWLTFDITRRLFDTHAAVAAGLLLAVTVQFTLQAHTAQIDGTLCFLTTLGLYGLLRHLLLGPDWRWYAIAGVAAGVGIITKGVGFLPLLVLLPWFAMRRAGMVAAPSGSALQWLLAPALSLAVVACWLAPMLAASMDDPALTAYRNEILFGQTIDRYVDATGHRKPFHYHITSVVPWAWLPLSLMLPWLVARWRDDWRRRDARTLLPLGWAALVFVFFLFSSGKRGVYILPALPAVIIAAAPWLRDMLSLRWPNAIARTSIALFAVLAVAGYFQLPRIIEENIGAPDPALLALTHGFTVALALVASAFVMPWPTRAPGLVRFGGFLAVLWLLLGWWIMPRIDDLRSGAPVMRTARAALPAGAELAIASPKESLILHAGGPLANFGHRRTDRDREMMDAAAWLRGNGARRLVLPDENVEFCFDTDGARDIGFAHRRRWLLLEPLAVREDCAAQGDPAVVIRYEPAAELPSLVRIVAGILGKSR